MRALLLLPLLLLACADDKDPTVCPSDPACTTYSPGTNPPPETTADTADTSGVTTTTPGDTDTDPATTAITLATTPGTSENSTSEPSPTTGSTFPPPTTAESSSGPSEETRGDPYGLCGWNRGGGYYACTDDGAEPGLEGRAPIDCGGDLVEGAPCSDDDGPVDSVGCCTLAGVLYFCDTGGDSTIYRQDCGN